MKIKVKNLIEKKNVLNEMRANSTSMTLQEQRFFLIYLSKINSRDISTRIVRFPMDEFKAIMDLGRLNISSLEKATDRLLQKIVKVPYNEGWEKFQLFKKCRLDKDDIGDWYIEIDAHDDALPLMFEFKDKYFTYKLSNILRLKSINQQRMYEILKQYEKIGSRIFGVDELKELLFIGKDEYSYYKDFRVRVLDACQQALKEHTDIKYTYESHGKKGAGGKVLALKFIIEKNEDYTDQLTLAEFIEEQQAADESDLKDDGVYARKPYNERIELLSDACNDEFSTEEIKLIYGLILDHEAQLSTDAIAIHDYVQRRYQYLNSKAQKKKIPHRFGYLKSLIGKEI